MKEDEKCWNEEAKNVLRGNHSKNDELERKKK